MSQNLDEAACLVAEIGLDAAAGCQQDADRKRLQHRIIALEGSRLCVSMPIRLEGDLRHLAMVGPAGES
jgi:hypothetical protein